MKASHVEIDDQSSRLRKAFAREAPAIGGNNFFTGEYESRGGSTGMSISDQASWESFWKHTLNETPPGPLPHGAEAHMMAEHHVGDPVELIPEKITRKNGENNIRWNRNHTATPENPGGKSRYAVLLMPKGMTSQLYIDVFVAQEQKAVAERVREQEIEALKVFTQGTTAPVGTLPTLRLKK